MELLFNRKSFGSIEPDSGHQERRLQRRFTALVIPPQQLALFTGCPAAQWITPAVESNQLFKIPSVIPLMTIGPAGGGTRLWCHLPWNDERAEKVILSKVNNENNISWKKMSFNPLTSCSWNKVLAPIWNSEDVPASVLLSGRLRDKDKVLIKEKFWVS